MIKRKFSVPTDPDWFAWIKDVRAARLKFRAAPQQSEDARIDEALYKRQRHRFLAAYHDKCAYCELKLTPGQRAGDVEHYRPKGRVVNLDGKPVHSPARKHRGYHWLAYSWRNLLPACLACNRPGTGPDGVFSGKWDRFPTEDGFWAETVRELRKEIPLLLNPWQDDPEDHLVFDETGVIGHKTRRGQVTIEVLGLNREGLPEARKKAFRDAANAFRSLHEAYARRDEREAREFESDLKAFITGRAEFSAAGRESIRQSKRLLEDLMAKVPFPI